MLKLFSSKNYKKLLDQKDQELQQCRVEATRAAKLLVRRDIALTETNDLLQQTNKAKSEFISLAAHQLRTPVATINWYIANILEGKDSTIFSKKQKEKLLQIQSSSQHMAELIDTFLLMSRLELGASGASNHKIDFDLLIEELELSTNHLVKNKKIDFSIVLGVKHEICTDRSMLKTIIENIVSNALKYSPNGGKVSVNLSTMKAGKDFGGRAMKEDTFCLKVVDNGYGIPLDQQGRIFDRLFRAKNVVNKDINGTGLGLYIVRLMTLQFEGDIWFTSKENKGTTFYLTIPVHMISNC